jgi:Glycosyl transferase family 4 group
LERGVANGLAVARLCEWLARDGFVPDIVIGHNGWGEILYLKDLWPQPRCSAISNSSIG